MLLVLAATNKGLKVKSQESVNKIKKHNCSFYETIQANIYLFHKGLLVQKNGNMNLFVKYEKYA